MSRFDHIKLYKLVNKPVKVLVILFLSAPFCALAQKDTSKRQSIDIISSYKPVLRNVSKINLTATPISVDTNSIRLSYNIPPLNLFYSYQPVLLKPLALSIDSSLILGTRNYVKLGYGNYATPVLQSAFGFGDGKKSLINLYANYIASKGKIDFQDATIANIKASGSYFMPHNEWYGSIGYNINKYYQYGYDHNLLTFSKEAVDRTNTDFSFKTGFKNTVTEEKKIEYNPNIGLDLFSTRDFKETDVIVAVPLKLIIDNKWTASFLLHDDIYDQRNVLSNSSSSNSIIKLNPALEYRTDLYTLHAGLLPVIDNITGTYILPDFFASAQIKNNLIFNAGFQGNIIKNSYKTLTGENPYIDLEQINAATLINGPVKNTKQVELFAGLRTKIRHHMDVFAKIGLIRYSNMPLFVNDTISGKGFIVKNEGKLNDVNIHGEIRYYSQDKFTISGILDMNTYSGLQDNANAWQLVPVKFTGQLNWNITKDIILKSSLYTISGITALLKNNAEKKLPAGIDFSLGTEVRISKMIKAWFDINNLLNNKYQRWNNYQVYGTQVMGGLIFHFN